MSRNVHKKLHHKCALTLLPKHQTRFHNAFVVTLLKLLFICKYKQVNCFELLLKYFLEVGCEEYLLILGNLCLCRCIFQIRHDLSYKFKDFDDDGDDDFDEVEFHCC